MEGIHGVHHGEHAHAAEGDIAENKDLAALSYVWVLAVVVHFSVRHSPFTTFHCRQALVLFALSIVVSFLPIIGVVLLFLVAALSVVGFVNAAQGLRKDLPFVGPVARADLPALRLQLSEAWAWLRSLPRRRRASSHSGHGHSL